ncbi:hypothetical protein V3C99_010390 [Haemonchus contortus]
MWHTAALLITVFSTYVYSYGVASIGSEQSYRKLCNMDIFTAYSDNAACPCGPIVLCLGCPTGCCCPRSSPVASISYPPPHPPDYTKLAVNLLRTTTLFTSLLLFHVF